MQGDQIEICYNANFRKENMFNGINHRFRGICLGDCLGNPSKMGGWITGHAPHVITTDDKEGQANRVRQEYEQKPNLPEGILL